LKSKILTYYCLRGTGATGVESVTWRIDLIGPNMWRTSPASSTSTVVFPAHIIAMSVGWVALALMPFVAVALYDRSPQAMT